LEVDKRCGGIRKGLDSLIRNDLPALHHHGTGLAGWEEKNGFDTCYDDEMDGEPKCLSGKTGPSSIEPVGFN